MVRACIAACLLAALAAASTLRADGQEPLRMPELVLRPSAPRGLLPRQRSEPDDPSRVLQVAHLEDDAELAPIVPAPETPTPAEPQSSRSAPPEVLPREGLIRPA